MSCHVFPFEEQIKRQLTAAPNDSAPLKEDAGLQFGNIRARTWREDRWIKHETLPLRDLESQHGNSEVTKH